MKSLRLRLRPEILAICRLAGGKEPPRWLGQSNLWSLTRRDDELSAVCAWSSVPVQIPKEGPWQALEVAGTLDFSLTGILASLTRPLAEASISLFALSTYDTDLILVREEAMPRAVEVLRAADFSIETGSPEA